MPPFFRIVLRSVLPAVAGCIMLSGPALAGPPPGTVSQATSVPAPTPNPLAFSGKFRSYYFTRQNASGNPGAQFDFDTKKCNNAGGSATCINQATWTQAIDLHADYHFAGGGWYAGATYFFSDPFAGPCSTAAAHAKGQPCVAQIPPNTNPDDTVPGFILDTFYEAYLAYKTPEFSAKLGDQLFNSPWANPVDTRIKPAAFQGADFIYSPKGWLAEAAYMFQWENRTSNRFTSNTLITSYPAGGSGMASNILQPGCKGSTCGGFTNPGFLYTRAGYLPNHNLSANVYYWDVNQIANVFWGDGQYTWTAPAFRPFVAVQGGWETGSGAAQAGKIQSSLIGVQAGANLTRDIVLAASYDSIPWHYDTLAALPGAASCSNSTFQIHAGGAVYPATTFPYFLPSNAAQCFQHAGGSTTIAYGGWASPYTDNYANAPIFTTAISQSMADRRSPGNSWKVGAAYTAIDKRLVFIASNSWFDYSNQFAPQHTTEFDLDGTYRFARVPQSGPYHGLQLRYRYADRRYSNTYCGAWKTTCAADMQAGTAVLSGNPLFKYNRAMLEYDF
jgi:hypothetical protein